MSAFSSDNETRYARLKELLNPFNVGTTGSLACAKIFCYKSLFKRESILILTKASFQQL